MSNLKGPSTPMRPGAGVPTPQAVNRQQVQREVQRQAKNQQLGTMQKLADGAASASAASKSSSPSSSSSSSSKSPAPSSSKSAPKSSSSKGSGAGEAKQQGGVKAQKGGKQPGVDRMKVGEAAEIEGGSSDAFDGDTSAMHDLRRVLGAVDEQPNQASATRDFDTFDPNLSAAEVEQLGSLRAAVHMVKLLDHWSQNGLERSQAVSEASAMLLSFARPESARGVMKELDRAPIKAVYPLEIQINLLEQVPNFFPNVARADLIGNKDVLARGERILAGHDCRVHFPSTMKLKSFALLTPGRPGYEFEPLRPGTYRLLVDTPGEWEFAIRGEQQGKQLIDTFKVTVRDPAAVGNEPALMEDNVSDELVPMGTQEYQALKLDGNDEKS